MTLSLCAETVYRWVSLGLGLRDERVPCENTFCGSPLRTSVEMEVSLDEHRLISSLPRGNGLEGVYSTIGAPDEVLRTERGRAIQVTYYHAIPSATLVLIQRGNDPLEVITIPQPKRDS